MSKFSNIIFPFFGLKRKPYKIIYELDKISIKLRENSIPLLLDDKNIINSDYLTRLSLVDNRIHFDYTCINLQSLILSKVKWGLDSNAQIHDLSKLEEFKSKTCKSTKQKDNLIWLKGISYPFEIPEFLSDMDTTNMYFHLVYIDYVWYTAEVNYNPNKREIVKL